MSSFDFSPSFSDKVASELNSRKESIKNKEIDWNYKQYAYFELKSLSGGSVSNLKDNDSIFAARPRGIFKVGTLDAPINKYRSDTDGKQYEGGGGKNYLESLYDGNDPRALKPILSSATITSNGGEDIYNAYISEVTVNFKVFTLNQLSTVERELFSLGAKAQISYGWLKRGGSANKGKLIIKIFNFGYTMGSDGSFDCNIKGLTEGVFIGAKSISQVVNLTKAEQDALGESSAAGATLPLALKAKSMVAFGINNGGSTPSIPAVASPSNPFPLPGTPPTTPTVSFGIMETANDTSISPPYKFYMTTFKKESTEGDDSNSTDAITYISFGDLIRFIDNRVTTAGGTTQQFSFHSNAEFTKIANAGDSISNSLYGSADPTQFIFPSNMAEYGGQTFGFNVSSSTTVSLGSNASNFKDVVPQDYDIKNILISIDTISEVYESLSSKRKDEKPIPPTMVKFIEGLSSRIFRLSGGLVDIKTTAQSSRQNSKILERYDIFNNTEAQKEAPSPTSYKFSILGNDSIVKSYKLDSDFDVDTMLMMSVGRVRAGLFNIKPLKKLYPEIGKLEDEVADVDLVAAKNSGVSDAKVISTFNDAGVTWPSPRVPSTETKILLPKLTMNGQGVDKKKISTLADNMRDQLAKRDGRMNTFQTLPFYLKLGITIDGVNGIGFLQPITIDRLPYKYRRVGAKFLVTSIEHSFDGQGGWETSLDTVMKIGK
jgi:hypothetical protein